MNNFSQACKYYGLTISVTKVNVMGQGTEEVPFITICNYNLVGVHQLTYFWVDNRGNSLNGVRTFQANWKSISNNV